jgi:hypothetical protein
MRKGFTPIALLLLILVLSFGGYFAYRFYLQFTGAPLEKISIDPYASSLPVACTMEAKLCPDGSYVSRSGPKCEFSACPTAQTPITKTPLPTGGETFSESNCDKKGGVHIYPGLCFDLPEKDCVSLKNTKFGKCSDVPGYVGRCNTYCSGIVS